MNTSKLMTNRLVRILPSFMLVLFLFSNMACKKDKDSSNSGDDINSEDPESYVITIINKSGSPIYVYDWDGTLNPAVQTKPVTAGNPLTGDTLSRTMKTCQEPSNKNGRRIYFSDKELKKSLDDTASPDLPDVFNYNRDANVQYSFLEYMIDNNDNTYTVDISYIDGYSYPLTYKFSNLGTYTDAEEDHEYGFTSLPDLKAALEDKADYAWNALIWPDTVVCKWNSSSYPYGMGRIIGPNKVWTQMPHDTLNGNNVPESYLAFIISLPANGSQLFGENESNFNGWEQWAPSHNPSPSSTGYVQALHSVATADKNGKYGFFCYPNDDGQFTKLPASAICTVTVYSISGGD